VSRLTRRELVRLKWMLWHSACWTCECMPSVNLHLKMLGETFAFLEIHSHTSFRGRQQMQSSCICNLFFPALPKKNLQHLSVFNFWLSHTEIWIISWFPSTTFSGMQFVNSLECAFTKLSVSLLIQNLFSVKKKPSNQEWNVPSFAHTSQLASMNTTMPHGA